MNTAVSSGGCRYVLVTAARDEAEYIGRAVMCVLAQRLLPYRWVIVNDGSRDNTSDIVRCLAGSCANVTLLESRKGISRSFGSKAAAVRVGYDYLRDEEFAYIGNLDADVTIEPDFYEVLVQRMGQNPALGVAGGVIYDRNGGQYIRTISSLNHAPGAVQFFRRECYENVGGYRDVSVGGVDAMAELSAMMLGWEVQSFEDLPVFHHKPVGSGTHSSRAWKRAWRAGMTDYHLGTHPVFMIAKSARRVGEPPPVLSTVARLASFFYLLIRGAKRDASDDLTSFVRQRQMQRLLRLFSDDGQRGEIGHLQKKR